MFFDEIIIELSLLFGKFVQIGVLRAVIGEA
jgi:hypothetical protein